MLRVTIRTAVFPSEDPDKVAKAVLNLFPAARLQTPKKGILEAHADSLESLRSLVRKQKILDSTRRMLLNGLDASGKRAVFHLNKQAAHRGRVNFSVEKDPPLGDLEVEVEGEHLEPLFKEMAPMTLRGIPVSEERAEQELAKRRARKKSSTSREGVSDQEDADEEGFD